MSEKVAVVTGAARASAPRSPPGSPRTALAVAVVDLEEVVR
jgi:hypothetical protein